jgi:hypothetical protein
MKASLAVSAGPGRGLPVDLIGATGFYADGGGEVSFRRRAQQDRARPGATARAALA